MKTIMISFREGGENGGPYNSHKRIMESELKNKYKFVPLILPKGRLGILNPKVTISLIKQIKKHKPHAIHFTGLELSGFHVALACKIIGFKNTILAVHGSTNESMYYSKKFLKQKVIIFLERLTLDWSKKIFTVSDYVSSWKTIEGTSKNFGTIYNIVEDNSEIKYDLRKEIDLKKSDIVIVSTGRIEIEKGFGLIEKIIKKTNDLKNIKYVIVGEGNYLNQMKINLKSEIQNKNVHFMGYREEVHSILNSCDVFLLPSYHETLCMSLAEARIKGLILLGSNVGGIPEIIDNKGNGFLFEVNECRDYIKLIKKISLEEKYYNSLKNQVSKVDNGKFSTNNILSKLDQLYEEMT